MGRGAQVQKCDHFFRIAFYGPEDPPMGSFGAGTGFLGGVGWLEAVSALSDRRFSLILKNVKCDTFK